MKKLAWLLILTLLAFLLSACVTAPMQGLLYTGTEHTIHDRSSGPLIGDAQVLKRGESCSWTNWYFLNIFLFYYGGGGSIKEAAASANITKIAIVDRKSRSYFSIFPFYVSECVVVWGE